MRAFAALEWLCHGGCGTTLDDVHYNPNRKYCDECRKKKNKEKCRNHYRSKKVHVDSFKIQQVEYVLKTNLLVSVGEIAAFAGISRRVVYVYVNLLKKKYRIKNTKNFYEFLGEKYANG